MLICSKFILTRKSFVSLFLVPGYFPFQKGEFNRFRALSTSILGSPHLLALAVTLAIAWCTYSPESHEDCKVIYSEVTDRKKCPEYNITSSVIATYQPREKLQFLSYLNPVVNNYEEIWSGQNRTAEKLQKHG